MISFIVGDRDASKSLVGDLSVESRSDECLVDAVFVIRNQLDDFVFERKIRMRETKSSLDELSQTQGTVENDGHGRWTRRESAEKTG